MEYETAEISFKKIQSNDGEPGYFNSSLWDTLSGEYYRSFTEKQDYYHILIIGDGMRTGR